MKVLEALVSLEVILLGLQMAPSYVSSHDFVFLCTHLPGVPLWIRSLVIPYWIGSDPHDLI